ncbi:MAG: TetR/AcrR family transcriptional regulator [Kibdelosporangium sp.]
MERPTDPESQTRSRTRRAILAAAASVLAQNRSATLPEVAEAAGVGRTTLHRYFPDRDALINAAVQDSVQAIDDAVTEARLDEGSPLEAMRRLVMAYLHVGDRLVFLFNDPHVMRGYGVENTGEPPDADPVAALIGRGQEAGLFDPELSPQWIQHVLWALVYTGIEEISNGTLSRHGAAATVTRTLERGIRP